MKAYQQHYTGRILIHVSLWFLITGFSYPALAEESSGGTTRFVPNEEMPAILNMIAERARANYKRIVTWSGEVGVRWDLLHTGAQAEEVLEFTDAKGAAPKAILQKIEEKITFAVDANKNLVYGDSLREKPSKYFDKGSRADLGNSGSRPVRSTLIARPDCALEGKFLDFEKMSNRHAVKKPSRREADTGLYEPVFVGDPRRAFMPAGVVIWDSLEGLVERINKFGKIEFDGYRVELKERKNGEAVEYELIEPAVVSLKRSDPNHYAITTKIFSSRCGFNLPNNAVIFGHRGSGYILLGNR